MSIPLSSVARVPNDRAPPCSARSLRRPRKARSRARHLFVLACVAVAAPAQAQSLEISDLGSLGGNHVAAHAINDAGLIVGASLDGRPEKVAFVKPAGGPMLGLLGDRNTRNAYSEARDVNARGEVLLFHAFRSSRTSYALFLWTEAGGLVSIGGGADEPVGLDDRARIVVNGIGERTAQRSAFEARRTAMIREAPDHLQTKLPELTAAASRGTRAFGVNGRGDVVGQAPDAAGVDWPVWWDAEGRTLHVLPSALAGGPPLPGRARAINDRGTIVGELSVPRATEPDGTSCDPAVANDGCTTVRVVAWRGPEHTLTDLGPGEVEAVNAHDIAVGDRLWDIPRERVLALPADGDDAMLAHDINADGVLVGERGLRAVRVRYLP